ncbi:MAG: ribosome small subunit-dependent GTPase A [Rickettsiales bacterium]|nr:ribosome small subunit-dependent GTPase A [Rickettsiales bacterium]
MRNRDSNLYDRHQNQRAKAKKERAKAKHFGHREDVTSTFDGKNGPIAVVSASSSFSTTSVYMDGIFFKTKLSKEMNASATKQIVVGDMVLLDDKNDITGILPRRSYLARLRGDNTKFSPHAFSEHVIVANIDTGVIVTTVRSPEFQPRLIDRYLVLCRYGGVEPLICLNKCDLSSEYPEILDWYRKIGIKVIKTSTIDGSGLEPLLDAVEGKTIAFVGSSGVGKSSLINKINPELNIRTQKISQKGNQGRHTTTSSNLYQINKTTLLIDTPGIRSLGLSGIQAKDIKYYFREFEPYEIFCKYSDCMHSHENECAVKEAISKGKIPKERYESYLRLIDDENPAAN